MKYKKWNQAAPHRASVAALARAGLPPLAAEVLCARGLADPAEALAFLSDQEMPDPFLLRDMDRAVARVRTALDRGEAMAVYGDYDVDGITSTCLLTGFLQSLGGNVVPYIPDRLEEGYGLNADAVDALAAAGVTLIVSVDCGITAIHEAAYARERGVDLVITDHHECKGSLPSALAVVDPRRQDCPYPFKELAGVGVALNLALALTAPEDRGLELDRWVDLAAVGTVADVMRLTGENRALVVRGLEALNRAPRPGLLALMRESGADGKPLTASSIGFTLAPRMNAAGRMGEAMTAVRLLLTQDEEEAGALARQLCLLNRERQRVEGEIYDACAALLERTPALHARCAVLAGEGWHQGVVGIVASRLAEKFACPAFMICLQDGKGKGSCRSYGGFNLFHALESCEDLLEGFGGHALAAGFTIREEHIPALRARLDAALEAWTGGAELLSCLEVDAEFPDVQLLAVGEIEGLAVLEPHGAGNPKPVFSLCGCTVASLSDVGGGRHLKLKLGKNGQNWEAIFFSATAAASGLVPGDRVDVAFTPQVNEFRGARTVQLLVADLRPAQTRVEAECALFERLHKGEALTASEAESLTPSRSEFANLWRYLSGHGRQGPVEDTARRLARNVAKAYGTQETVMRTLVCLEVMGEHGLIRVERCTDHLSIALCETAGKVDLETSPLMRRLRGLARGDGRDRVLS